MDATSINEERRFKILRVGYLIHGVVLFIFGLLLTVISIPEFYKVIIYKLNNASYPISPDHWMFFWFGYFILALLIGVLFIFTYFGLKSEKKYARFTGAIGCILFIFFWLLAFPIYYFVCYNSIFIYDLRYNPFLLYVIIFLLPSIILLISTMRLWKKIPGHISISINRKTKKAIAILIIVILLVGTLAYVIPQVQKNIALSPLKYANYEFGWGFNPPDGWQIEQNSDYVFFRPPLENNVSKDILLTVYGWPELDEPIKLDNHVKSKQQTIAWNVNHTANYSIISEGYMTVNSWDAYAFVYTRDWSNENHTKMKYKEVFVVGNDHLVHFTYESPLIFYDVYEDAVEQSINSLKIV